MAIQPERSEVRSRQQRRNGSSDIQTANPVLITSARRVQFPAARGHGDHACRLFRRDWPRRAAREEPP